MTYSYDVQTLYTYAYVRKVLHVHITCSNATIYLKIHLVDLDLGGYHNVELL